MTLFKLLRRNLVFHRRGNLAVLLGVAVGTAVLTGALLVADSLRGSLRERALRQLGGVHYAMLPGRFFRNTLNINIHHALGTFDYYLVATAEARNRRAGDVVLH